MLCSSTLAGKTGWWEVVWLRVLLSGLPGVQAISASVCAVDQEIHSREPTSVWVSCVSNFLKYERCHAGAYKLRSHRMCRQIFTPRERGHEVAAVRAKIIQSVSYTHLTLPTIYSV